MPALGLSLVESGETLPALHDLWQDPSDHLHKTSKLSVEIQQYHNNKTFTCRICPLMENECTSTVNLS